jgi:thiosulfate dehydrogenase [quinone] large subunit
MEAINKAQQTSLVVLRTLIGWHFVYEGWSKVILPAWSRDGMPLARFSSAGYLRASTGPFAELFRGMADSSLLPWLDPLIAWGLVLVGLGLMLGLFTQLACVGGLVLLSLFYVSWLPTRGVPQVGAEGSYLIVNKNLIEAAALLVVLVFRTGRIAGLDLLRGRSRASASAPLAEAAQ